MWPQTHPRVLLTPHVQEGPGEQSLGLSTPTTCCHLLRSPNVGIIPPQFSEMIMYHFFKKKAKKCVFENNSQKQQTAGAVQSRGNCLASTAAPTLCRNRLLPLCHPMGPSTQNRNEERSSSVPKEVLTRLLRTGHRQPRDNKEPENTQHKPRWAAELPLSWDTPPWGLELRAPRRSSPAGWPGRPTGQWGGTQQTTGT